MICGPCPAVAVRMIPGRSIKVRSGDSGELIRTTMASDEKCCEFWVSVSVKRKMIVFNSLGDSGVIACDDDVVETEHDQDVPSSVRRNTSRTGQRVISPDPLGSGTPESASKTELFPLL